MFPKEAGDGGTLMIDCELKRNSGSTQRSREQLASGGGGAPRLPMTFCRFQRLQDRMVSCEHPASMALRSQLWFH